MGRTVEISTSGGRTLVGCWYQAGLPTASVVVHGATAVPQRYYARFASALAALGVNVLTYDYRGIGASADRPTREDPATLDDWIEDASVAQRWLVTRSPGQPIVAIGHSFGGQIAANVDAPPAASILSVAAGSGYVGGFPTWQQGPLHLAWAVGVPLLTAAVGSLPGWSGLGEDLPSGVARQWARWCRSPDYLLCERGRFEPGFANYRGRVLALSFPDDRYAPRKNILWLNAQYKAAMVQHREVKPESVGVERIGHFGFFRPESRERLWPHAIEFVKASTAGPALESGIIANLRHGR